MNKKTVKTTLAVLVLCFIVWDIWLAIDGTPENTVTAVVRDLINGWEIISATIFGVISGGLIVHFIGWK